MMENTPEEIRVGLTLEEIEVLKAASVDAQARARRNGLPKVESVLFRLLDKITAAK